MGLLNSATTYNAQVRADRRAAALDRQNPAIKADEARARGVYDSVAALDVTSDGRRRVARDGSSNENKRGPKPTLTRLRGGLEASLASERGARTARARRLAAKG
jgi:hypothetical protein